MAEEPLEKAARMAGTVLGLFFALIAMAVIVTFLYEIIGVWGVILPFGVAVGFYLLARGRKT